MVTIKKWVKITKPEIWRNLEKFREIQRNIKDIFKNIRKFLDIWGRLDLQRFKVLKNFTQDNKYKTKYILINNKVR